MARIIPLTRGLSTVIDDADLALVSRFSWQAFLAKSGQWYATNRKCGRLHRLIMDAPAGMQVDHRNGNTLDNRRDNLRICTHQQNQWNRKRSPGRSRFKGVTFWGSRPTRKPWMARIEKNGKRIGLGYFATEAEAAQAYDRAARELFGEFAAPNFPAA